MFKPKINAPNMIVYFTLGLVLSSFIQPKLLLASYASIALIYFVLIYKRKKMDSVVTSLATWVLVGSSVLVINKLDPFPLNILEIVISEVIAFGLAVVLLYMYKSISSLPNKIISQVELHVKDKEVSSSE